MAVIPVNISTNRPVIAANLEQLRYLVFQGMTGDNGKSAYELAVELGFAGTEQDWINSLHGANGTDGKDGKDGADGKNYGIVVDGSVDHVLELKSTEAEEIDVTPEALGATVEKNLFNTDLQTSGKWLGGSCYDSKRDRVVLAFGDTSGTSILIAMDTDFETVQKTETINCNHANDIEYIPTGDIILVTDSALSDTLLIVDPETLQVTGSTTDYPNGGNYLAQVAYDTENDVLYIGGNGVGYSYHYTEKTLISELAISNNGIASILKTGGKVIERQSACVYNGLFTFLCDLKDSGSHVQEHWLIQFNEESEFIRAFCVDSIIGWEELESAAVVGGVFYGLFQLGVSNIYVTRLDQFGKSNVFKGSYRISEGEDLNKLLVNGEYRCPSNTIGQTLLNAPTAKAFTLINVPISNGTYIVQTVTDIDGDVYSRRVSVYPGDFGSQPWRGMNPKIKVFSGLQITPSANTWETVVAAGNMPTLASDKILSINLISIGVESTDDYSLLTRVTSAGLQIKASTAQKYTLTISVSYIN